MERTSRMELGSFDAAGVEVVDVEDVMAGGGA